MISRKSLILIASALPTITRFDYWEIDMGPFYHCQACGVMGDDAGEGFTEITEEMVLEDFSFDADSHPGDLEEALSSVGEVLCNACGSVDVILVA